MDGELQVFQLRNNQPMAVLTSSTSVCQSIFYTKVYLRFYYYLVASFQFNALVLVLGLNLYHCV